MEISNYTLLELVELRNRIQDRINKTEDGFVYVNRVHSYGNHYDVVSPNAVVAEEVSDRYNGDNGITELYTNNPDIDFVVYGGTYFINTIEEYYEWIEWLTLKNLIRDTQLDIEEWEDRENQPAYMRSQIEPIWSRAQLEHEVQELAKLEARVVKPKAINQSNFTFEDVEDTLD